MTEEKKTRQEAGKLGGEANAKKQDKDFYEKIGKKRRGSYCKNS